MMEAALAAQLAPWITPAVVIALFVWLRADIKGLETRLGGLERDVAEMKGKLGVIETSILGCNDRGAG